MEVTILRLCLFFVEHPSNASSSHFGGLLAPECKPVLGYQQVGIEMLTSPGFLGVPPPPSRVTTQLSPPGRAGAVPEELMARPGGLF